MVEYLNKIITKFKKIEEIKTNILIRFKKCNTKCQIQWVCLKDCHNLKKLSTILIKNNWMKLKRKDKLHLAKRERDKI
jgi:hypothetical protein